MGHFAKTGLKWLLSSIALSSQARAFYIPGKPTRHFSQMFL